MGLIARLLSFVRGERRGAKLTDVKVDPGGGNLLTVEHFAAAGDDSSPLPDDYVAIVKIAREGAYVAVGYADVANTPKAQPGDKRIYARDPDTGAVVIDIWLKNDGSIVVENNTGSFSLAASGVFSVNGVTIDTDGNITTTGKVDAGELEADTSLIGGGIEMITHTHTQPNDSGGDTEGPTSGPI